MPHAISLHESDASFQLTIDTHSLSVSNGDITAARADAVVCPVNRSLDVETGVAAQIFKAAGRQVRGQKPVIPEPLGKVVVLPAGRLPAKYIFLTVVLGERSLSAMKRAIGDAVQRSLHYAEFLKLDSIAFPLIGSPEVLPPYEMVAKEMFDAVAKVVSRKKSRVRALSFSVFNPSAFEAFRAEAKRLAGGTTI